MSTAKDHFVLQDGSRLPAGPDYLQPFLSPTTPGTSFRSSAPAGTVTDRQHGRVLLQVHQIISLFAEFGIDLKDKRLHDIGTGNGLIPRLLLELTDLGDAVGSDPFLDGEHTTSWQPHDQDQAFADNCKMIRDYCGNILDYDKYSHLLAHESHSMVPRSVAIPEQPAKSYRFLQASVHDLPVDDEIYDLFYCKAIEHINDWPGFFRAIAKSANPGAVIYLKHRSFYSFLGPHRYSTLDIPWGHLLLSDDDFRRCAQERFPDDADKMIDFYFNELTYPRQTVPDMVRIAGEEGFSPVTVMTEPFRGLAGAKPLISEIPDFWDRVKANHPTVGADEVFSGMHHILLRVDG